MEGGPDLIVAPLPGAATVAVGAWMRSGSACEPRGLAGATHLLEHLLLRRCGGRTPELIAELIDSLGDGVDAFTTREFCAITAHTPADRLSEALALVLDAIFAPELHEDEVVLERQVVDAEFDLVQDSPAEVAAEKALVACWGGHPLARPVLGDRDVVRRLTGVELSRFHGEHFTADRLLLVAAGAVEEAQVAPFLASLPAGRGRTPALSPPAWRTGFLVEEREGLEQVYANLVLPALPLRHPEAMTLGVLQQLLGGGNSSRLFRELRDRLGLVYEVESAVYATSVAGVLEVTFSCPTRQVEPCWNALLRVLEQVAEGGVTDGEVALAKQAMSAGLVLGTEGSDAVMEAHAGEFLARGRRFEAARLQDELGAVTPERVRELARQVVSLDRIAGAVCGPAGRVWLPTSLARRVA